MSRSVMQLCAFILRLAADQRDKLAAPLHAPSAGATPPQLRTMRELAGELGLPIPVVARVAREMGYENLVFDEQEAAAVTAVLQDRPPPRAA